MPNLSECVVRSGALRFRTSTRLHLELYCNAPQTWIVVWPLLNVGFGCFSLSFSPGRYRTFWSVGLGWYSTLHSSVYALFLHSPTSQFCLLLHHCILCIRWHGLIHSLYRLVWSIDFSAFRNFLIVLQQRLSPANSFIWTKGELGSFSTTFTILFFSHLLRAGGRPVRVTS